LAPLAMNESLLLDAWGRNPGSRGPPSSKTPLPVTQRARRRLTTNGSLDVHDRELCTYMYMYMHMYTSPLTDKHRALS